MYRIFLPILIFFSLVVVFVQCIPYPQRDYSKPSSSSFASPFAPQGLGESAMSSWAKSKEKKNEIGAVIANARNTGWGQTAANGYSNVGGDVLANSLQDPYAKQ